jgi:hypothetical protein
MLSLLRAVRGRLYEGEKLYDGENTMEGEKRNANQVYHSMDGRGFLKSC